MKVSREDYISYLKEISGEYTTCLIKIIHEGRVEAIKDVDYIAGLTSISEKVCFLSKLDVDDKENIGANKYLSHYLIKDNKKIAAWLWQFGIVENINYNLIRYKYNLITNYISSILKTNIKFSVYDVACVIDYIFSCNDKLDNSIISSSVVLDNWNYHYNETGLSELAWMDNSNEFIDEYIKEASE